MENASKALIIAGAILISILLISVGIMVMNSTSGVTDEMTSQMDSTQRQSFNAQFTNYQGSGKSVSQVRSLYNLVISSNSTHDDSAKVIMKVTGTTVAGDEAVSDAAAILSGLSSTKTYTISIGYDSDTGLVSTITVT